VENGRLSAPPEAVRREEPLLLGLRALHQFPGEQGGAGDRGQGGQGGGHRPPLGGPLVRQRIVLGPVAPQFLPQFGGDRRAHPVQDEQHDPPLPLDGHGLDHARQEGLDGEHAAGVGAHRQPPGEGVVDRPPPLANVGAQPVVGRSERGIGVTARLKVLQRLIHPSGFGQVAFHRRRHRLRLRRRIGGEPLGEPLPHPCPGDAHARVRVGGQAVRSQLPDGAGDRW
jgi:hypothetical protein